MVFIHGVNKLREQLPFSGSPPLNTYSLHLISDLRASGGSEYNRFTPEVGTKCHHQGQCSMLTALQAHNLLHPINGFTITTIAHLG